MTLMTEHAETDFRESEDRMRLLNFLRVRLAHLPTPLLPLDKLSAKLAGPRIWMKRDDCTCLAMGGNKVRKLEFLMADAKRKGADTIVSHGATQSNHTRQTAAVTANLGYDCYILLEDRANCISTDYNYNGNVLLDRLYGAKIGKRPAGADMMQEMERLAEKLRRRGKNPYIIPDGGSNEIGALGYVDAALELVAQSDKMGLKIDHIVHATCSAGTQAGLLAGLAALQSDIPVLGIGVARPKAKLEQAVFRLAQRTADFIGSSSAVRRRQVVVNTDYVGAGYGIPTEAMVEAVKLIARNEAALLDPVYSGKAMAGLIELVRQGEFKKGQNIVFIHTGGGAAMFGYPDCFDLPDYQI